MLIYGQIEQVREAVKAWKKRAKALALYLQWDISTRDTRA